MIDFVYHFLRPLKIIVLLTLFSGLLFLDRKKQIHRHLLTILWVCFLTEAINSILIVNKKTIGLFVSISIIIHHGLWIWMLAKNAAQKNAAFLLLGCFLLFGLINISFFEGTKEFNGYTFVFGAFIYIIIFIYESFCKLRLENFDFFTSNTFILLTAPVLFFFGYSFMFAFNNKNVTSYLLFGQLKLYTFISYFVNIVYYSLINLYIYREKKLKHVE
jgi:hypothetical protein